MNVYFLVEGLRTEMALYPSWLSVLCPKMVRLSSVFHVKDHGYFIFSGEGYPSILDNHLRSAIEDVNASSKFDYLAIVVDAEEDTVQSRVEEVENFMREEKLALNARCKLKVIVQNRCIETWLLGNRRIIDTNPNEVELRAYKRFYDVRAQDPEIMPLNVKFDRHAVWHLRYLKAAFREKRMTYTKRSPANAGERGYLQELKRRTHGTAHLSSFGDFLDFCETLNG